MDSAEPRIPIGNVTGSYNFNNKSVGVTKVGEENGASRGESSLTSVYDGSPHMTAETGSKRVAITSEVETKRPSTTQEIFFASTTTDNVSAHQDDDKPNSTPASEPQPSKNSNVSTKVDAPIISSNVNELPEIEVDSDVRPLLLEQWSHI
jgi:hypothetical protein